MRSVLLLIVLFKISATAVGSAQHWPHWRGPTHDGVSLEKGLPERWSATQGVAWKLPLPAFSGSTPIIWGDTIFLSVATGTRTGVIELWSIDRNKQAVTWKRRLTDSNHMERKQNMSSPVTDGTHVWVMTGLGVFKAFDFGGREIYVTTEEEGLTTVYRAGPKFEIIASNRLLDDCAPYCLSTVAISEGQLFLRTSSFLWAIGERRPSK